jgi:anti-sigma factor RsiW
MQDCRENFELLSSYLDLELPAEECLQIEAHLAGCAPCVEFVESLRKTVELCRQHQPREMPAPVSESARAELLAAWRKMLAARKR